MIVAAVIACDLVDPLLAMSIVLVAVLSQSLPPSNATAKGAIENMTTAEGDTQITSDGNGSPKGAASVQDLGMPKPDKLKYFAYPTISGPEEPEKIVDIASSGGTSFTLEPPPDAGAPKWLGPPTKSILSSANGHEPRLSVFVTLEDGVRIDALEESGTINIESPRSSLFLAYASDSSTDGNVKEKHVQLALYKVPDVQSSGKHGLVLHGQFGDDEVQMSYTPTQYPRTHFLIRDGSRLTIGWSDPYKHDGAIAEESVAATSGALLYDNKACIVNATKSPIGRIGSVVVYNDGMRDYLNDVMRGISRHTLLRNDLYKKLHDDFALLQDKVASSKHTPLVLDVTEACAAVSDWSRFDPIAVSEACRNAINESCKKDSSQPSCECWTEENMHKPECVALRAVYSGEKLGPVSKPRQDPAPVPEATPTPVAKITYEPSDYVPFPSWWQRLISPH
jgi:hypothetical protein